MANPKGISFENDREGKARYVRFDLQRYGKKLQPLLDELGYVNPPNGWEDALTLDEFAIKAKQILRNKFDERNKDS